MTTAQTAAMTAGRRADTTRRRERVLKALRDTTGNGGEVTVSGIARHAGIDRTFLYRHRDLLEQVHAAEAEAPTPRAPGQRSAEHHCNRTCSPRRNAPTASLPGSDNWRNGCPRTSARKPGKNQDSAPQPTSTNYK